MLQIDVNWMQANQRYLLSALDLVKCTLENHLARLQGRDSAVRSRDMLEQALIEAEDAMPARAHLSHLCEVFNLSAFERDVLLLCAGMELDSEFSALYRAIQSSISHQSTVDIDMKSSEGSTLVLPSFSLVREIFPHAYWEAFLPVSPLRYWNLIELGSEHLLMMKSLRIDEYILHYLTGALYLDERLTYQFETAVQGMAEDVVPSQRLLVNNITTLWSPYMRRPNHSSVHEDIPAVYPLVQLCGEDAISMHNVIAAACEELDLQFKALSFEYLVSLPAQDLARVMRLWERTALLHDVVLVLDCWHVDNSALENRRTLFWLVQHLSRPLIVMSRERLTLPSQARLSVTYDIARSNTDELRAIWQQYLANFSQFDTDYIDRLVAQFRISSAAVRGTVAEVFALPLSDLSTDELQARLWDGCRARARPSLSTLAQRIDLHMGWQDLVLPEPQLQLLHGIVAQVRNRTKVYDTWGFRPAGNARGLGISVLFAGMSGTGKTLAAEVLAYELQLDLYRIDLSSVVSKYIGETEKNLQRIFDAAEEGGVVLLFDEADALFGKRSDVKDSHDRYANIEVSYLLQRMETYRGLAILTTNLKSSVDVAFLRRLRFVLQFPFPDATQRAEIWRRAFPAALPVSNLDMNKLARLSVTGGNIRNIALNAAFFAAEEQKTLQMKHVLEAARMEYAKLEKSLTDSEIEGWM